ncbi:MAG TPA: endonuclease/exonuclease/phosphatase family protein, partial [Gemmatimonadaceae bacterium]|nr:endonuclease/exonuclease/phosphatase family protein [Gemmatimonadaceae bacterium]
MRQIFRLAPILGLSLAVACAHLPSGNTGIPLRVMTYNIRSGNGDLSGTVQAIRGAGPDVVGLQEVDVHW